MRRSLILFLLIWGYQSFADNLRTPSHLQIPPQPYDNNVHLLGDEESKLVAGFRFPLATHHTNKFHEVWFYVRPNGSGYVVVVAAGFPYGDTEKARIYNPPQEILSVASQVFGTSFLINGGHRLEGPAGRLLLRLEPDNQLYVWEWRNSRKWVPKSVLYKLPIEESIESFDIRNIKPVLPEFEGAADCAHLLIFPVHEFKE